MNTSNPFLWTSLLSIFLNRLSKRYMPVLLLLVLPMLVSAKKKPEVYEPFAYGLQSAGTPFTLQFQKGKAHNHPLFAIWLADENGKFIETLYVSQSIGKGVFLRADRKTGAWKAGEIQRPAALPYWAHQRNVLNAYGTYLPTPQQPEVDGLTGATPQKSFTMQLRSSRPLQGKYQIMLELNQSWDWNEYWYNDRFPGDREYMTSSQPAVVYSAFIDVPAAGKTFELKPVGHSHPSGMDGSLNGDLRTLTTALQIAGRISVTVW